MFNDFKPEVRIGTECIGAENAHLRRVGTKVFTLEYV